MLILLLAAFLCLANCSTSELQYANDPLVCTQLTAAARDEIKNLPGMEFSLGPSFKQYSGFLQVTETHFLHYWFVTSLNNPCQDPLLFWFNGGPGCSSMEGLLSELGLFAVNSDGRTVRRNPYAWNKNASIVFIESPVGVGYSYASDGELGRFDDDNTAAGNYEAVKQFYAKFPLFRQNPVYVTGESYSGIYEPTLVSRILDGQTEFPVNLKGMAIGNGMMNREMDHDTMVRFAYAHGLVGEEARMEVRKCCGGCGDCNMGAFYGSCREAIMDIIQFCWNGGLNTYDLYRDCANIYRSTSKIRALWRATFPKQIFPNRTLEKIVNLEGKHLLDLDCLDETHLNKYMSNAQVREALHIPENLPKWELCSDWVSEMYVQNPRADMAPLVLKAIGAGLRVLLYYGDTDMACNFMLGQRFSARLGLKLIEEAKPWRFGGQIAGFKTLYERDLTFITVRGAGHMVPTWRPAEIEYAFGQFLFNRSI